MQQLATAAPPDAPLLVFDFETTGLDPNKHEPIQVAAMLVTHDLQVFDEFESLIRPLRPEDASPVAMEIHNKPMEALLAAPHPREVFARLQEFAGRGGKVVLSGYNVGFDIRFLEVAEAAYGFRIERHDKVIDAIELFRDFMGMRPRQRGAKLTDATARFQIPHDAHDALGDVRATVEVLRRLRTDSPAPAPAPRMPIFQAATPPPMVVPSFVPSTLQAAIFEWVSTGQGDAFVEAVAGSGKTTTIEHAAKLVGDASVLFLAFNKHIVKELQTRLPRSTTVSTIHSIGLRAVNRALGRTEIDDYKYRNLIKQYLIDQMVEDKENEIAGQLRDLVSYAQSGLVNPNNQEAVLRMIEHFELEVTDKPFSLKALLALLTEGYKMARDERVISYSDMLWLPHVMRLEPSKYDWVFVDEAQDLSPAQRQIALKSRGPHGRMLFVGDERQAIYGFAGADSASIRAIIEKTGAARFPLSICYRCPTSHIALAQDIVPQIQAAPGAPDGAVYELEYDEFLRSVQDGDLILCRLTAPLVEATFELIRMGKPAKMRGRDIGQGLLSVLAKIEKLQGFQLMMFPSFADQHLVMQTTALRDQKDSEMKLAKVIDQVESLRAIYYVALPRDLETFKASIAALFDDGRPCITLSTVHRAKGLEEKRVFILEPDKMPHPNAKQAWQREQEMNLKYVALTRAKRELFFVKEAIKP